MGMGIIAGGVPIGDDVFKRNFVAQKVDEVSGQIEQNHTLLRSVNAHDHAFQVLRLSDSHRLDYLTQVVSPSTPGVIEEYRRFDRVLHNLAVAAVGVDFQNLNPATHSHPNLVLQRAHLAKRHKGVGILQVADVCLASYVGCVNMTVPRFPDGAQADGTIIRGLASHMVDAVGTAADFESSHDRYATFLGSGLSSAAGFRLAWETMRGEAGPDPAGVFSAAAESAPGTPREEDLQEADAERLRLQRLCTCERQRTRLRALGQQMTTLEWNDPIRMAWNNSSTGELWSTLPRRETRCSSTAFSMAFSIYLGTTNPTIEAVINSGKTTFLDKIVRGGNHFSRVLDPYGQSLSLFGAKGNFRLGMHDAIERELAAVAKTCGLNAQQQGPEVFGSVIPPGPGRDSYARNVRENSQRGNQGGVVPDITIRNFPTEDGALPRTHVYEVKTFGHKPQFYGRAGPDRTP
jgi:hypothetical protein